MNRIFLENHGRMTNQIAAWGKAMCVVQGMPFKQLLINYPPLVGMVELPSCDFFAESTSKWPRIHSDDIKAESQPDSVWDASDLWNVPHSMAKFSGYIRSMRFNPSVTQEVDVLMGDENYIGLHVRYGDYMAVDWNHPPVPMPDFVRATNDYFLSALSVCYSAIPFRKVFVASDGTPEELKWLPESVRNQPDRNPAYDLYALSKCDIIIGSVSTFGHVASIYGDCPFIVPGMTREIMKAKAESVK